MEERKQVMRFTMKRITNNRVFKLYVFPSCKQRTKPICLFHLRDYSE